jgi:hypothetical protein
MNIILRVPLVVTGLGLIGTAFGALGGAWLTQRRADRREELNWNRDLEREQARWAREDTARTFEYRRKAYVDFYQAAGPRHRHGGPDQPGRLTVAEIQDRIKNVAGFDADTAVWIGLSQHNAGNAQRWRVRGTTRAGTASESGTTRSWLRGHYGGASSTYLPRRLGSRPKHRL